MSKMVTRCPQCHTSFRVTDEHLKVAKGAVRCGSCLHVFQAAQHWVTDPPLPKPAASSPFAIDVDEASETPAAPSAGNRFAFDQSAIDGGSTAAAPAPARIRQPADDDERFSDDSPLDDDSDIADVLGGPPAAEVGPAVDEDALIGDTGEFPQAVADSGKPLVADDGEEDFDAVIARHMQVTPAARQQEAVSDEAWAKDMLAELEESEREKPADFAALEGSRHLFADDAHHSVDLARRDLGLDHADLESGEPSRAAMIAHIEPAPLDFGQQYDYASLKGFLIRHMMVVALLLLLLGQYTFFNFTELAQRQAYRPWLAAVCRTGICRLPEISNRKAIKVSNMIVRKHATVDNALQVDAIITNTADSEQPFPQLELYFNDMVQLPVASRRFEPAEYLAGEMTGKTLMPPGQPVHIAFEIINPGEKAVNWSLQVARSVQSGDN